MSLSWGSERPRRRLLVALAATLPALLLAAEASASLQSRLTRALGRSGIPWSATGAFVTNLSTGRVVYARGASRSLRPASNEKLLVALAALDDLGPSAQIPTHVLGTGERDGRVWRGSLFLKGFGDPTLSGGDLKRLARRIHDSGVRRITGSIRGDETAFDKRRMAPGWKPSFYKLECPPLSALIVDRAIVRGRTTTYPALAAARELKAALRSRGIAVPGKARVGDAPSDARLLTGTRSPPLSAIVRRMNKVSDNFYAEMVLKHLGLVATQRKGTTAAGAAAVRRELANRGIPLAGVRVAGRLRALASRPADYARYRCPAPVRLAGRRDSPSVLRVAAARGHRRDARGPPGEASGPRPSPREDRHDQQLVGALGLRRHAVRLRSPPDRKSGPVDTGAAEPGPVRADPGAAGGLGVTRPARVRRTPARQGSGRRPAAPS